ncbi:MAG: hypothetical protein ACP5QK_04605 [Myxococcota bacterium]
MQTNISKVMRVCATCEYWASNRDTDYMKMNVVIDMLASNGVCMRAGSPFFRVRTTPNTSCMNWQMWQILR